MRFLMVTTPEDGAEPTPEALMALGQMAQELAAQGILIDTGGIQPTSTGTNVSFADGEFVITDGPFAETKEMLAGYIIVEVESKDQAIEISRRFYETMGGGSGEILQMFSGGPPQDA